MVISDITTIEQLNKNLNMGPGYGGYLDILKAIKLPKKEWEGFCHWQEDHYTRHCLNNCDDFELILMCWKKDQASKIHSYNFQQGWIKVLQGELSIDVYRIDSKTRESVLDETIVVKEREYTYLNDNMGFHRVRASAEGNTVSLHLHASRVREWEVYNPDNQSFERVQPKYDTLSADCSE